MKPISKSEMLARIVESGNEPFTIKYVKGSGKDIGSLRVKRCYYGAPNPHPKGDAQEVSPRKYSRKTYLEFNSIPLTEFGSGKLLTPFLSHIIEFNGQQVIH